MWRFTIKVKWWIQPFVEIHMDYLPLEGWRWFSKYKSQKKILVICEMDRKGFGIRHDQTRSIVPVQKCEESTVSPLASFDNYMCKYIVRITRIPTTTRAFQHTSRDQRPWIFYFVFNRYVFSQTRWIGSTTGTQVTSDQVTVRPIVFILRNSNGF